MTGAPHLEAVPSVCDRLPIIRFAGEMVALIKSARAAARRLWFGMRSRMFVALVLTALVTLTTAALTLLAPLKSALNNDSRRIGEGR